MLRQCIHFRTVTTHLIKYTKKSRGNNVWQNDSMQFKLMLTLECVFPRKAQYSEPSSLVISLEIHYRPILFVYGYKKTGNLSILVLGTGHWGISVLFTVGKVADQAPHPYYGYEVLPHPVATDVMPNHHTVRHG